MGGGDRQRTLLRWLPAIGWMGVIFVLSSISGLRVSDDAGIDEPLRVLAHFVTYAVLGGLTLFALTSRWPLDSRTATAALAISLLYAVTDELHQAFVPGRAAQIEDLFADAVGAAVGIAVMWILLARRTSTTA